MAASATPTTQSGILTTTFPRKEVQKIAFTDHPFLGMVKKDSEVTGEGELIPVRVGSATGIATDFATAQANRNPNTYRKFTLTLHDDFASTSITNKAIRLAKGSGAVIEGLKDECMGLAERLGASLAHGMYGNGGGAIARVGSGEGTTTITLLEPNDIVHFYIGQKLDGATTDGTSGAVINGGSESIIGAIDADLGKITKTGGNNWNHANGINGIAANNWLFTDSYFGAKIKGLGAWLPATPPAPGDSFYGVDRSIDSRLSGVRVAAAANIEQTLLKASARVFREGGKLDTILMHPMDLEDLIIALGQKVQYVQKGDTSEVTAGYSGVKIVGQGGPMGVFADAFCPKGTAFGLTLSTWTLFSAGDAPGYLDEDGVGKLLREAAAAAVEVRMVYYAALGCFAPWKNCRIALPVQP